MSSERHVHLDRRAVLLVVGCTVLWGLGQIASKVALVTLVNEWNDYIWPLLVLKDQKLYTLQVALRSIVGADNIDWSVLLSASVISLVPMVVIFLVFQRYIMNADMNAGLKD